MNKIYLVVGGASVASLAVGATGGYLIAKRRFDAEIDDRINEEVDKTKKYYSVLLMQAKEKPDSPADISIDPRARKKYESTDDWQQRLAETDGDAVKPDEDEVKPADPILEEQANRALTDYRGFGVKPPLEEIAKNIFTNEAKPKKKLPPRDPATGHFVSSHQAKADFADPPFVATETEKLLRQKTAETTPYIITQDEFLLNEFEYEQENLKYFHNNKTLIQVFDNEPVDIERVGEVNLTLFPEVPDGQPRIICVRNEGLEIDYEILLTDESLTEYMGLGEEDDIDEIDAAEYANAHANED